MHPGRTARVFKGKVERPAMRGGLGVYTINHTPPRQRWRQRGVVMLTQVAQAGRGSVAQYLQYYARCIRPYL